jgi:hypothetical protein
MDIFAIILMIMLGIIAVMGVFVCICILSILLKIIAEQAEEKHNTHTEPPQGK